MEVVKLVWDVLKTIWDIGKTLGPHVARRFRLRRGSWPQLVREGAKSIGTPADEIEDLLEAFDNSAFFVPKSQHPILADIRSLVWAAYQRLDELRLLAVAEQSQDVQERCWSINQIGQRAGAYAIPILRSIAHSLKTSEQVNKAALRAIEEIENREATGSGAARKSIERIR